MVQSFALCDFENVASTSEFKPEILTNTVAVSIVTIR